MSISAESKPSVSRVLLATDFSEPSGAAFEASVDLCHVLQASLYILNVFEYGSISPPECGGQLLDYDTFYEEAETCLQKLIERARQRGVEVSGSIGTGIADDCILDYARSEASDLVVMGTRSIHGIERLIFGSTAEAILRKSNCPVLTVGPQASPRTIEMQANDGIVLFATDFHQATTEALSHAAAFSKSMGLPLHCLNVLPRGVEYGKRKGVIPIIIKEGLQHLAAQLAGAAAPPVCTVAYGSEISNAVVEYARDYRARLIVLGVRRASLAASHIPAHIAYRIITEAPCPVLTIAYPPEYQNARWNSSEGNASEIRNPVTIQ